MKASTFFHKALFSATILSIFICSSASADEAYYYMTYPHMIYTESYKYCTEISNDGIIVTNSYQHGISLGKRATLITVYNTEHELVIQQPLESYSVNGTIVDVSKVGDYLYFICRLNVYAYTSMPYQTRKHELRRLDLNTGKVEVLLGRKLSPKSILYADEDKIYLTSDFGLVVYNVAEQTYSRLLSLNEYEYDQEAGWLHIYGAKYDYIYNTLENIWQKYEISPTLSDSDKSGTTCCVNDKYILKSTGINGHN